MARQSAKKSELLNTDFRELFQKENHRQIIETIREISSLEAISKDEIKPVIESFTVNFSQEKIIIPEKYKRDYLLLNPEISSITEFCKLDTSQLIRQLELQISFNNDKNSVFKILFLSGINSKYIIDYQKLFQTDPYYSSLWYWLFFQNKSSYINQKNYHNIRRHIEKIELIKNQICIASSHIISAYFVVSYVYPEKEDSFRKIINRIIREKNIINIPKLYFQPDRKKIVIISSRWQAGHSVYRSLYPGIKKLSQEFQLSLIMLGNDNKDDKLTDFSIFEQVTKINQNEKGIIDIGPLIRNKYFISFFTDIGLLPESLFLANLRISPVQISINGHPGSSCGTEIDYWINSEYLGNLAEFENQYSERLILVKGCGLFPEKPKILIKRDRSVTNNKLIINCPWMAQKINRDNLETLNKIAEKSETEIVFRFFPSDMANYYNRYQFQNTIRDFFDSGQTEIIWKLEYPQYINKIAEGDITLISYPFSGFITVLDSLALNIPVISRKGDNTSSSLASVLLGLADLSELIAYTEEEYIEKSLRLINNHKYRKDISDKIYQKALKKIYYPGYENELLKAMIYIRENYHYLKKSDSKSPIFIL